MILETAADPSTHPAILWIAAIVGAAVVVSGAAPKIFGNLSQTVHDWVSRNRTAAIEADDADIADLRRERDYLRGVADERLREIAARDALAAAHVIWDWARYQAAIKAGHQVEPPPPLIPDTPPDPTAPPTDLKGAEFDDFILLADRAPDGRWGPSPTDLPTWYDPPA